MQHVAIVSVGNELLFGETVDTNAAWIGRTFSAWGLEVVAGWTVRDRAAEIQEAVAQGMRRADVVVVTGGLGPTSDDVTKPAVAGLLGVRLVEDASVRRAVEEHFRTVGLEGVPERSRGQWEVLEGSTPLANTRGTAPGLLLERNEWTFVLLPGVPSELQGIVEGPLRETWSARLGGLRRVHHLVIHTTGIEEPELAALVEERLPAVGAEVRERVDIAYLPDELGVDLRLTVRDDDATAAESDLRAFEAAIADALAPWRFEAPSGELVEAVSLLLRERGLVLAAAESCTGGMLAGWMTDRAGSSEVFVGAVVSYADDVKVAQLGVSATDLEREGAVSEPIARQMASGVAERLGADAGIGITGIAGPGGGSEEKPVGTVWIAVALDGVVEARRHRFAGDRGAIRRRSVQAALAALYHRLAGPRA